MYHVNILLFDLNQVTSLDYQWCSSESLEKGGTWKVWKTRVTIAAWYLKITHMIEYYQHRAAVSVYITPAPICYKLSS